MKTYSLFNSATQKKLILPRLGVWYTHDLNEAEEMKVSAEEYMKALGIDPSSISIIETEENLAG